MLKVLRCEKPDRPVLFELFLNSELYEYLAGRKLESDSALDSLKLVTEAYTAAGYDYVTAHGANLQFNPTKKTTVKTRSLNEGFSVTDWESYEKFVWPEPENCDYSRLSDIKPFLPEGMKLMVMGPGGVLENTIDIVGYDNLCYMLYEETELVERIFNDVGSRLLQYYKIVAQYDTVGMLMSNDDWGFNTQTFLPPVLMRKYVIPWHKQIAAAAHEAGKPALLHSCGYAEEVFGDIIDDMGFDAKHSYEDNIMPIEKCYQKYAGRIALLGGIDVDFLIKAPVEKVIDRAKNLLCMAEEKGGYALGSGNSIPYYVPIERYLAMISCAY